MENFDSIEDAHEVYPERSYLISWAQKELIKNVLNRLGGGRFEREIMIEGTIYFVYRIN